MIAQDVSAPSLLSFNGAEVRERFNEIENGIRGAIDFVRLNFKVEVQTNLPYPSMIVPLAVFFAVEDGQGLRLKDAQREELVLWFWRSCFSRRYSSAVLRNLKRDLVEAYKLRIKGNPGLADFKGPTIDSDWFLNNRFTISSVNTRTFILLLARHSPRSFVSGTPLDLSRVLKTYNRTEFHHLFPQSFLKGQSRSANDINRLANIAFLSGADNKTLGGVAPSIYKSRMDHDHLEEVLESAAVPTSLFDDDYERFLAERAQILSGIANGLTSWIS